MKELGKKLYAPHEDAKTCSEFQHQSQIESGQEDKVLRRQITLHVCFIFFNASIFVTVNTHVSFAQVRIFPYLIGRESAFADNLKWMACANKGWRFSDKHF